MLSHNKQQQQQHVASGAEARRERLAEAVDRLLLSSPSRVLYSEEAFEQAFRQLVSAATDDPPPGRLESLREMRRIRASSARLRELLSRPPAAPQRTPEWFEARRSCVTASELNEILRDPGAVEDVVRRKTSPEAASGGGGRQSLSGVPAVEWGKLFEPVACAVYSRRTGSDVHEFGLLVHDSEPRLGASPDGITPQGVMLEIKCPYTRRISPDVPRAYWVQVQTQMEVAGLDRCDFLECRFRTYGSPDEYAADAHPDDPARSASSGLERGLVFRDNERVVFGDDDAPSRTPSQQEDYAAATFWVLEVYDCKRVRRDPTFLASALPVLRSATSLLDRSHRRAESHEHGHASVGAPLPESRKESTAKAASEEAGFKPDRTRAGPAVATPSALARGDFAFLPDPSAA